MTVRLHGASDLMAASPVGPATNAVIFVIDGAGPVDLARTAIPHIDDLARRGVTYRNAWAGQLPNVGPASNATIATGAFPRRHGVVGTQWRDPRTGQIARPTNAQQVQLGALDQVMEAKNTSPFAALLKERRPGAGVLSVGGVGCANADAAGSWLADYVVCPTRKGSRWVPSTVAGHSLPLGTLAGDKWSAPTRQGAGVFGQRGWYLGEEDHWLARSSIGVMKRTRPMLVVINFPEIAAIAPHLSGAQRDRVVSRLMQGIDANIGHVVAELRRERVANRTVFMVTSDQSVVDLPNRIPVARLNRAIVAAGGQSVYIDPGGTSVLGLQDALQAQPVVQALQDDRIHGVDALYFKTRSAPGWQYQVQYVDPDLTPAFESTLEYELRSMASEASADVVVVGSPGTGFLGGPGGNVATGSGLSAQWEAQHIPLIVAGHGIVPGVTSSYPARLVDIVPTLSAAMGLEQRNADGVLLADAMLQPPNGARQAQQAESGRQSRMIEALRSRIPASVR